MKTNSKKRKTQPDSIIDLTLKTFSVCLMMHENEVVEHWVISDDFIDREERSDLEELNGQDIGDLSPHDCGTYWKLDIDGDDEENLKVLMENYPDIDRESFVATGGKWKDFHTYEPLKNNVNGRIYSHIYVMFTQS